MKRFKVSEVAKNFGLSTTAIYKHLKRFQPHLKDHVTKDGGITLVSEEGVNILRESITASTVSSREIAPFQDNRLDGIEKAMLAMAEKMQTMVEENRALRSEVSNLQHLLEYKKPKEQQEENRINSQKFQTRQPDRQEVVSSQRELSFLESIHASFDNFMGFLFG